MAGLNQVRTEVIALLYHNECKCNIHNKGWISGLVIHGMKTSICFTKIFLDSRCERLSSFHPIWRICSPKCWPGVSKLKYVNLFKILPTLFYHLMIKKN